MTTPQPPALKVSDSPYAVGTPEHSAWIKNSFIPSVASNRMEEDRAKYGAEAQGRKLIDGRKSWLDEIYTQWVSSFLAPRDDPQARREAIIDKAIRNWVAGGNWVPDTFRIPVIDPSPLTAWTSDPPPPLELAPTISSIDISREEFYFRAHMYGLTFPKRPFDIRSITNV